MTTQEPDWVPPGVDPTQANPARVYDYLLGGSHNFPADQDAARALAQIEPGTPALVRANRAFLGRAVRFLAAKGIRQFLDIGSGIPTEGNVHEIAWQEAPAPGSSTSRWTPLPLRTAGRSWPGNITRPSSKPTSVSRRRFWPTTTPGG